MKIKRYTRTFEYNALEVSSFHDLLDILKAKHPGEPLIGYRAKKVNDKLIITLEYAKGE